MYGLFGRDQVKHTPSASAQVRFKIGHTALAAADRQVETEGVVFEQGRSLLYRAHTAALLKDAAVHVTAVAKVPCQTFGLLYHRGTIRRALPLRGRVSSRSAVNCGWRSALSEVHSSDVRQTCGVCGGDPFKKDNFKDAVL